MEKVNAHKLVLAAASPFFKNTFSSPGNVNSCINLDGIKKSVLIAILNFVYDGEATLAQDLINDFLIAAKKLKIKSLTSSESKKPVMMNVSSGNKCGPFAEKETQSSMPEKTIQGESDLCSDITELFNGDVDNIEEPYFCEESDDDSNLVNLDGIGEQENQVDSELSNSSLRSNEKTSVQTSRRKSLARHGKPQSLNEKAFKDSDSDSSCDSKEDIDSDWEPEEDQNRVEDDHNEKSSMKYISGSDNVTEMMENHGCGKLWVKREGVRGRRRQESREMNIEATFVRGKQKGTSILQDPDGYTYQKNKRRNGDKILWVCATHRNLGCSASANTNGFILERLNGTHQNHHIPIVEKKRAPQIDKKKGFQIWGSNGEGVPGVFIPGSAGGLVLVDPNGFEYTKDAQKKSGKANWICRKYGHRNRKNPGFEKCNATAMTQGKMLIRKVLFCPHQNNIYLS